MKIIMESVEKLSKVNFFSVCDVCMDIKEAMEMSSGDTIEIFIIRQDSIRFPILLPAIAPNLLDAYYANRIRATIYLKEIEAIRDYTLHKDMTWDGIIELNLDRQKFDEFYNKLIDVYEKRAVKPNKQKTNDGGSVKFRFSNGVLFRDFSDEVLIFKDENEQEFRVIKTAMNLPINERIDALTDNMELTFRQLYDTARRLNEKIKTTFGRENFFETDSTNKLVRRVIE